MTSANTDGTRKRFTPEFVVTLLLLATYVAWMLWLPAWPSQDGPVHMYYTSIFGKLLGQTDPAVARYFQIRHLFPPYALYYYALLGLSKFAPLFLADRFVICAYLVSFVFGFRFLSKRLGPAGDATTLLATLLLLNWPLGMGFVNYCLSLSFAMWAIGLWLRFGERHDLPLRVGFVLVAFVAVLTHPVPLLVIVCLCAVLLVVDLVFARIHRVESTRLWKRDIVTLLFASPAVLYILLFTTAHPLQAVLPETGSFAARVAHHALRFAHEDGMSVLYGPLLPSRIYRVALGVLLVVCLAVTLRQIFRSLRKRQWTAADTISMLGILLLLALPFVPLDLNGLFYFADRLPLLVWVSLLLAATQSNVLAGTASELSSRTSALKPGRIAVIAFAVVANGVLLIAATKVLGPIARSMAAVEGTPISVSHQVGFVMEDPRPPSDVPDGPSWDPYYWAAIHVVRHNDAVLANAPWMDETILPLTASPLLPEQHIPALQTPVPNHLYAVLMASLLKRQEAMGAVSFIVVQQHDRPESAMDPDPARNLEGGLGVPWTCQAKTLEWYQLCRSQDGQSGHRTVENRLR